MFLIELQYFDSCPHWQELYENLQEAMTQVIGKKNVCLKIIDTPELAIRFKFRGSPTLLINGVDIEGMPEPREPRLSCRNYLKGLPTAEEIARKLRELDAVSMN